ncbi:MAG: (Fe-S)-binding protein [Geobacter sp.]|nr:(Fe-S)-binding protein [Geobacter sp.]
MATNDCSAAMADMVAACTSCGECVRPCSFLQQQGTPAAIAGRDDAESTLLSAFGCSLCGLCDAVCPEGLSPSAMFLAMRQQAVRNGLIDLKPYAPWLNYEKLGSSPLFKRDLIPSGCTTVFFPGCSLPGTRPDAVQGLYRLLRTHDPAIGLVLDCCGKISHDLGLTEQFTSIFNRLSTRLHNKGVTRILTACPGCSKILRKFGIQFEVASLYEVLVSSVPLADVSNQNRVVTIHDPCPARFDQPQQQAVRQLINQCGYQIEELPSHGQTTRCCGQGGMVEGCVPGTVKQESRIIAAEAAGRPVVSSCGACCETLASTTPSAHIADLLTGTGTFTAQPVSSLKRWLNRLKLRFARLI